MQCILQVMIQNSKCAASNDPELQECAIFFDQMVLLIGQVFHSLTYHRWENVLSTLICKKARVKDIKKEQPPHMTDIGNFYFFGGKFEEKLIKVTNAK